MEHHNNQPRKSTDVQLRLVDESGMGHLHTLKIPPHKMLLNYKQNKE